ncbi:histidine phosphatase family protein [Halobium salinum]|uniref:Histidine phosphatase family protein n=1 Tax=Halobium salinum TaxID=1364940 RepID=A0ABD5PFA2_9EURY|nr:histidine phosphatase family protein [Halobium salinum]
MKLASDGVAGGRTPAESAAATAANALCPLPAKSGEMATVVLVRHGETTWNRDGRVQGWAPSPLTERGHAQARALGAHLATTYDADRVVSSDLRRAVETTDHVRRALSLDATFDPAWRERNFGRLQGLTDAELFGTFPQFALAATGYAAALETPEDGEALVDTRERVLGAWRELRTSLAPDETVVVVSHGGPLYLLLGELKGLDVVSAIVDQEQGNCAVNELRVGGDGSVTLLREDDRAHLDGVDVGDETDVDAGVTRE